MAIIDIFLIATVLVGFVFGLIGNWWRRLITIIIFAAIVLVGYFGFFEYFSSWIRYDLIDWLVESGYIQPLSFELAPDFVLRFQNVEDFFIVLQNLGFDPIVLKGSCEGAVKAIIASAFVFVASIVSEVLSFLLYWVLLRWIMPKKARSGFLSKIFGAAIGGAFALVSCIIGLGLTGSFMGAISESILPAAADSSSSLFKLLDKLVFSQGLLTHEQFITYLNYACGACDPLFSESVLVRPIFEALDQMGFSPLQIITVTSVNDAGENVKITFRDNFSALIQDVVDVGLPKLDSIVANLT